MRGGGRGNNRECRAVGVNVPVSLATSVNLVEKEPWVRGDQERGGVEGGNTLQKGQENVRS